MVMWDIRGRKFSHWIGFLWTSMICINLLNSVCQSSILSILAHWFTSRTTVPLVSGYSQHSEFSYLRWYCMPAVCVRVENNVPTALPQWQLYLWSLTTILPLKRLQMMQASENYFKRPLDWLVMCFNSEHLFVMLWLLGVMDTTISQPIRSM